MENYEEDFVNEEIVEFEIEGRKFKYKPTTAGDENTWIEEYMEIDADGKPRQNLSKINECKIRNLVEVPYEKELIKKIMGVDKEWKNLNNKEKWELISKLKSKTFDKIIIEMNKIDSPSNIVKKN